MFIALLGVSFSPGQAFDPGLYQWKSEVEASPVSASSVEPQTVSATYYAPASRLSVAVRLPVLSGHRMVDFPMHGYFSAGVNDFSSNENPRYSSSLNSSFAAPRTDSGEMDLRQIPARSNFPWAEFIGPQWQDHFLFDPNLLSERVSLSGSARRSIADFRSASRAAELAARQPTVN